MQKLLDDLTSLCKTKKYDFLTENSVNEKKFLYLYALYHYYDGNDDDLEKVDEHCNYTQTYEDYSKGYFENIEDGYDHKKLDILIPYYIENNAQFELNKLINRLSSTLHIIKLINNGYFNDAANKSKIREFYEPSSEKDTILNLKLITNYIPSFEQKLEIKKEIEKFNQMPDNNNIKCGDIAFGDDITNEVSQLSSDAQYVENGIFELDKPNNILYYGDERSAIVNISAKSLQSIYSRYGQAGLFAANLRGFVKNDKIDEEIQKSVTENGDEFWYLNNGIIIVCDDYRIIDTKISLKNFSIVNGGQTTVNIGTIPFYNDFFVSCKIIKSKTQNHDENIRFASRVAEASNTQKPIKSTDIIANRPEQKLLKENLAKINIFIQIKRGDRQTLQIKQKYPEKWQKTKNDEVAQLLYAGMYQHPGIARNNKNSLFSNDDKYNLIFKTTCDLEYIKDLLILKSCYQDWMSKVKKDVYTDATKIGLVKNGMLYFIAAVNLIAKFYYSQELVEKIRQVSISSDYGKAIISFQTFNHRIFNGEYCDLKKNIFELLDLIYDKYIRKAYLKSKDLNKNIVYSNYTKTDSNYFEIAERIFEDIIVGDTAYNMKVLLPILHKENTNEAKITKSLVENAFEDAKNIQKKEEEIDPLDELLKTKLKEYSKNKFKEINKKDFPIVSTRDIDKLIKYKPKTIKELEKNRCFRYNAIVKVNTYGQDIVDIIASVYKIK